MIESGPQDVMPSYAVLVDKLMRFSRRCQGFCIVVASDQAQQLGQLLKI